MSIFARIFERIGKKLGFKVDSQGKMRGLLWQLQKQTGYTADRLSKVQRSAETVAPDLVGKVGQLYEDCGAGSARDYLDLLAESKAPKKKER